MASRLGLSVRDTPASVAVANRNDIERHGAQNFEDAANARDNASAPHGFGGSSLPWFHQQQITQMFNGINVSGGLARPVDSWIYDRVELVGGPSSLINGAGSVGGNELRDQTGNPRRTSGRRPRQLRQL
jgi:iron complex outermembrane receptor protein